MEVVKIYQWSIPPELTGRFRRDWEKITKEVASGFGQSMATLFQMKNGDFISVTKWPNQDSYQKWVSWIMASQEGKLYHRYEIESGVPLVSLP